MSVFAEPLAQARCFAALPFPVSSDERDIWRVARQEALAALDLIEQRAAEMEKALRQIAEHGPDDGTRQIARAALSAREDTDKFPGGDPVEVRPSSDHGEEQAGLNGPSGSPTSPPGRVSDREEAQ